MPIERAARHERARHHAPHERVDAERRGPAGGGRGRFPFEETLAREPDADERHDDGVQHVVRLAGEKGGLQRGARRRQLARPRPRRASAPVVPARRAAATSSSATGNASAASPIAVQATGEPGSSSPSGQQQRDGRRRHQAAAQVVEDLPPRDERQPVALPAAIGRARPAAASRGSASRRAPSGAAASRARARSTGSRRRLRRR